MPFLLFNLMILDKVCVLSKEVESWLKKIILKNDYDKKIYTSFTSNFKEDSFYKNKAIPNLVFKELIFNTLFKKQLFITAKLKFILHSYFRAKAKALNII